VTPQRLREILTRLRAGHGLTTAEADELDVEVDRLTASPERQLVDLVGTIGARTATSFERAEQAHDRAALSLSHTDAVVARIEPVFTRLAAAEAAKLEQEVEAAKERRNWIRSLSTTALASKWFPALVTGIVTWILAQIGTWTAP
jgi:hypothetical protein